MLFARAPAAPVRYIFSFFRTDVYTLSRVSFLAVETARNGCGTTMYRATGGW